MCAKGHLAEAEVGGAIGSASVYGTRGSSISDLLTPHSAAIGDVLESLLTMAEDAFYAAASWMPLAACQNEMQIEHDEEEHPAEGRIDSEGLQVRGGERPGGEHLQREHRVARAVVAHFTPLDAGIALLPITALMLLLSARAGALAQRIGPRIPMTAGTVICAGALVLFSRIGANTSYIRDVLPAAVILGLACR